MLFIECNVNSLNLLLYFKKYINGVARQTMNIFIQCTLLFIVKKVCFK